MTDPAAMPVYTCDALHVMARAGTWPEDLRAVILDTQGNDTDAIAVDLPAVVMALHATPAADLCVTAADVAQVLQTIVVHPAPVLALVQLLRLTVGMPVAAALTAESLAYAALQGSAGFAQWRAGLIRKAAPRHDAPALRHVAHDRHDHLVLNRPARANMINMDLREALVAALGALALDGSARPILLTGAGRWFCAGGDVHEFGLVSSPDAGHVLRQRANLPAAVARVADRLHVHLHGAVIGAGIELAAFAGHVTAHPATTFRLPELGMGLLPGCGGTVSIPRRIGRQRFALLCLTGATLDAATALDWGLIDAISDKPPVF